MNGATVGFTDDDGKGEYDIKDVPHAMRLSTSGTFIHGNYWGADSVFGSVQHQPRLRRSERRQGRATTRPATPPGSTTTRSSATWSWSKNSDDKTIAAGQRPQRLEHDLGRVEGRVGAMRHLFSSAGSRVPVPVAALALVLTLAGCGGPGVGTGTGTAGSAASAAAGAQDVRAVAPATDDAGSGPSPAGETGTAAGATGEIGTATSTPAPSPSAPAELPGLGPRTLAEIPDNARQVLVVTGQDKDSPQSQVVLYQRTDDSGWTAGRTWAGAQRAQGLDRPPLRGRSALAHRCVHPHRRGRAARRPRHQTALRPGAGSFTSAAPASRASRSPAPSTTSSRSTTTASPAPPRSTGPAPSARTGAAASGCTSTTTGPTHGCVSLAKHHMNELLLSLDPDRHPVIVMGDARVPRTVTTRTQRQHHEPAPRIRSRIVNSQEFRWSYDTRRKSAVAAAAGLASTALLLAVLPGEAAQATPPGTSAYGRTVTLVTGDRVMTDGAGRVTGVVRAEGRERVPFSVRVVDGHTQVVPGDAELLLAQGKLDARLFDVTQLVADGYDDADRGDVPLIVTFKGKKAPSMTPFTGAGAKIGRALPVVNGKAIRPVKKRGTEFWDAVTGEDKGDGRRSSPPRRRSRSCGSTAGARPASTRACRRSARRRPGPPVTTARASRSPCWTPASTPPTPTSRAR